MLENQEFEAIWDRYGDRLLSFFQSRRSSPEEAEDLLQELFLRVHTGLCCLEDWAGLERWIYRVARNLLIDRYRARRPEEAYEDRFESPYGGAEYEENPAAQIAFSLREHVDQLPEPYREALILAEYEGLGPAELSARLGISLPAAKSRILRGRARLRALLLDCCHFELDRRGGIIDYEERCARCDLERASKGR